MPVPVQWGIGGYTHVSHVIYHDPSPVDSDEDPTGPAGLPHRHSCWNRTGAGPNITRECRKESNRKKSNRKKITEKKYRIQQYTKCKHLTV